MIVILSVNSALAGIHTDTWVTNVITFQSNDGRMFADRDEDGVWIQVDTHTGARIGDIEMTDLYLTETMNGRFVLANEYYADSTIYVGDEKQRAYDEWRAGISDWDFFWGTTLNPQNTGWNDFWNQCNDPNKTAADCAGTVFAGIGIVIIGTYVAITAVAAGTLALSVTIGPMAATAPGTSAIVPGVITQYSLAT